MNFRKEFLFSFIGLMIFVQAYLFCHKIMYSREMSLKH